LIGAAGSSGEPPKRYYLSAFFIIFTDMMWVWLLIDETPGF
jgi:hypothetical protein